MVATGHVIHVELGMFDTLACLNVAPVISVRSALHNVNFRRLGGQPPDSNEFVYFGRVCMLSDSTTCGFACC